MLFSCWHFSPALKTGALEKKRDPLSPGPEEDSGTRRYENTQVLLLPALKRIRGKEKKRKSSTKVEQIFSTRA